MYKNKTKKVVRKGARPSRRKGGKRVSKFLTVYDAKKLISKNIETKCAYKDYVTSTYSDRDDVLNVVQDVFGGIQQGSLDSSVPSSANRIGDSINARGVLFNFRITARPTYNHAGITYQLPYVYVRIMIIQARGPVSLLGVPNKARLFDQNAMVVNTAPTRIPFSNDNYGYVKKVLFNKVYKIRNSGLFVNNGVATDSLLANDMFFKKYIKMDKIIKYTDSLAGATNETVSPLHFCVIGETAPFLNTGMNLTVNSLFTISGYTKVYFKDA